MFELTALTGKRIISKALPKSVSGARTGSTPGLLTAAMTKMPVANCAKFWISRAGSCRGYSIPTPTPTTSAATNICSGRPDAVSSPEDWKRPLRHIQSWNHHSCMAAIP